MRLVEEGRIQPRRLRERDDRSERRAQLSKFDNRLLIGSAATTPYSEPDWQEGAVGAAWQALTTLHERAMRG